MRKAQKEIDSVLGEGEPTYELIKKLEYVPKAIISLNFFFSCQYLNSTHAEKCNTFETELI